MTTRHTIDPTVEEPLRHALACAIDKELDEARSYLQQLSDVQRVQAISYAMFAVGYVVNDVFERVDEGAALLAEEDIVPDVSPWFDVGSVDNVRALLLACATGDLDEPPEGVAPEKVPDLAIVIGGYLLGHFYPEDMEWSEYLDRIWNYAESLPDNA